jgi:hypothetical protein
MAQTFALLRHSGGAGRYLNRQPSTNIHMLEEKIAALTVAVEALTKVVQTLSIKQPEPAAAKPAKAPKPAKTEEAKVEEAAAPAPAPAPAEEPKAEEAPAKKVTLQDIREVAQQCLDNDKLSGVISINKKYGLRKIGEATEDKFADLHADLKALLNG